MNDKIGLSEVCCSRERRERGREGWGRGGGRERGRGGRRQTDKVIEREDS